MPLAVPNQPLSGYECSFVYWPGPGGGLFSGTLEPDPGSRGKRCARFQETPLPWPFAFLVHEVRSIATLEKAGSAVRCGSKKERVGMRCSPLANAASPWRRLLTEAL